MSTKPYLTQFENVLAKWKSLNLIAIYREDIGSASFKHIDPSIKDLNSKIEKINLIKEELSDNTLKVLARSYDEIINQLNSLSSLSIPDFVQQKGVIENKIIQESERLREYWPQVLSILNK